MRSTSPSTAGAVFLGAGLLDFQAELRAASGLDKLIVLGSVFVAAPLATFGAEHLAAPRSLAELVPVWFPARLFWACLVGIALIAAALSLIAKKYVRLSVPLLAAMFFVFVFTIHIPNAIANAKDRLFWTIAFATLPSRQVRLPWPGFRLRTRALAFQEC